MSRVVPTLARRLVTLVTLALVLTFATYVIFNVLPQNSANYLYPNLAHLSNADRARGDHALGIDKSVPQQYAHFLWRALHGDLGTSWDGARVNTATGKITGQHVGITLLRASAVTGSLVLGGAVFLVLIAVPLGMLAASRPRSRLDRVLVAVSLVGISTHPLVVALLVQTFLGNRWHLAPPSGYCALVPSWGTAGLSGFVGNFTTGTTCAGPVAWASHLVLPWLTFAVFFIALYMRMLRATMLEVMREPFVSTARAKGMSEWRLLRRHVLPNASLPVLTMLGMDVGTAFGIAIYVETVYGLPGLGRIALNALAGYLGFDLPFLVGIVLFVTVAIFALNMVIDGLYAAIDPRVALAARRARAQRAFGLM